MDGLIVRKKYLDLILDGNKDTGFLKTWEIRGYNTNKRGNIALIESGSGLVKGITDIIHSISYDPLVIDRDYHQLDNEGMEFVKKYKRCYAWLLNDSQRLKKPIRYKYPVGAVGWVKNVLR